jgi:uncharacterized protein
MTCGPQWLRAPVVKTMFSRRETAAGVTFAVKVHPRAKKNAITGEVGDALKISLTAPPIEGRANDACIAFLAQLLNVPRSSITIRSGHNSRNKAMRVARISATEVRNERTFDQILRFMDGLGAGPCSG